MNTYHYRLKDDAETYVIRAHSFELNPDGRARFFDDRSALLACILNVESVWLKGVDGEEVANVKVHGSPSLTAPSSGSLHTDAVGTSGCKATIEWMQPIHPEKA